MSTEAPFVLVTGVSGFIAGHVAVAFLRGGYNVRGTVRKRDSSIVESILEYAAEGHSGSLGRIDLVEADLLNPESFELAIEGCVGVVHTASPVMMNPKDPERDLIAPAVQGTLNVCRAALIEAKRWNEKTGFRFPVVITSSDSAVVESEHNALSISNRVYTEEHWNTSASLSSAYDLSKVKAERAAWEFLQPHEEIVKLVVINPALVVGPQIFKRVPESTSIFKDLLSGAFPLCPNFNWAIVDVRDVAAAHYIAFIDPNASGRNLLVNRNEWLPMVARTLKHQYPEYPIPIHAMPSIMLYAVALFDPRITVSWVRRQLGDPVRYSNQKAREKLGVKFTNFDCSLIDTAQRMIDLGVVRKPVSSSRAKDTVVMTLLGGGALAIGAAWYFGVNPFNKLAAAAASSSSPSAL